MRRKRERSPVNLGYLLEVSKMKRFKYCNRDNTVLQSSYLIPPIRGKKKRIFTRTRSSFIAAAIAAIAAANAPAAIASPITTQTGVDTYARVVARTLELRQQENVPGDVKIPQYIVDQVVAGELDRPVARDSGDQYGVNPGKNELAAYATNPFDCARAKAAIQDAENLERTLPRPER